jgi:cytochrome d ubiquinol oxidase subunit I
MHRKLLLAWLWAIPLGYLAVETGWVTREVGRQPWLIYGVMRTEEGASLLPRMTVASSLSIYAVIYTILFLAFIVFARRIIKKGPDMAAELP